MALFVLLCCYCCAGCYICYQGYRNRQRLSTGYADLVNYATGKADESQLTIVAVDAAAGQYRLYRPMTNNFKALQQHDSALVSQKHKVSGLSKATRNQVAADPMGADLTVDNTPGRNTPPVGSLNVLKKDDVSADLGLNPTLTETYDKEDLSGVQLVALKTIETEAGVQETQGGNA